MSQVKTEEGMVLSAHAAGSTEVTTGTSQRSGKDYAKFCTTLIASGGIYQFTQWAASESSKFDNDERPIHRFAEGQPVRVKVRPEFVKGVPIVQPVKGEVISDGTDKA